MKYFNRFFYVFLLFLFASCFIQISSALDIGFITTPPGAKTYVYNSGMGLDPGHMWGITPVYSSLGPVDPSGHDCLLTPYDFQFVKRGFLTYSGSFTLTSFDCTKRLEPIVISRSLTPIGPPTKIGVSLNDDWWLDANGNGVWDDGVDTYYSFGSANVQPVTGDWNNDGKTEIGVSLNNGWWLDSNGNGVWDDGVDTYYSFGSANVRPVTGKWS